MSDPYSEFTPPQAILIPARFNTADFTVWDRGTLERFARECADENKVLRADLAMAMDAWRKCLLTSAAEVVPCGTR